MASDQVYIASDQTFTIASDQIYIASDQIHIASDQAFTIASDQTFTLTNDHFSTIASDLNTDQLPVFYYVCTCSASYQVTNHKIDQKLPVSTGRLKSFLCQKKIYIYIH